LAMTFAPHPIFDIAAGTQAVPKCSGSNVRSSIALQRHPFDEGFLNHQGCWHSSLQSTVQPRADMSR
jgi:hypothetical protein